jgi:hypothetical protein
VIVTKKNPLLHEVGTKPNPAENWDTLTILRAYVADAEQLKNAVLKFNILAQIRTVESQSAGLQ